MLRHTCRYGNRFARWGLSALLLSGCAGIAVSSFEQLYGKAEPRERVVASLPADTIDYWTEVKPVVEGRCVVCHGCYDAPCQLKMSSIEGIERGGSPDQVYDQSRLEPAPPTRLFEDATSPSQWRSMNFHPVLNEYPDSPQANRQASVMYRMLELKDNNPLPAGPRLPDSFSLGLSRDQVCTAPEEFDSYAQEHPQWGMPYALPGLAEGERKVLMSWVEQGAPYTARPPLPAHYIDQVRVWESFLNGDSLKQQLASRYIYEHLSYAHLYFADIGEPRFFDLVRSSTPPGEPISILATRRPYDDPGAGRIYYRLREVVSAIVQKTHMPYALDAARLQRWRELFIEANYEVASLPSRDAASASNPFRTFGAIPEESRYRFMLEEAHFTINAFIKGPVCRGEVAVDVINDRFWVFFVEPGRPQEEELEAFLADSARRLDLPASTTTIYRPVHRWHEYRKQQTEFLQLKDRYMLEALERGGTVSLANIWDGDGHNDNAALTIFRHFDSATVEKGLLGQAPKTAWIIDYSLLERIHYLLVAGYDIFGNLGHQLDTRLYMDFLRMEGEANFLLLLPREARTQARDYWYRNADDALKTFVSSPLFEGREEPAINYSTGDAKLELFSLLKQRLAPVLPDAHQLAKIGNTDLAGQLDALNQLSGTPVNVLPEVAFLRVGSGAGAGYFTLVRNTAYANMSTVFRSASNRLPAEDTLTVLPGFIGAYPNVLMAVDAGATGAFVASVEALKTEDDYQRLLDNYGIRRTDKDFWRYSDEFHAGFRRADPLYYGVLDYNRLENR